MTPTEHLETDIAAAAFLMTRGYKFLRVEPSASGSWYVFFFLDDRGQIKKDVNDFYTGAVAPARKFAEAEKTLKDALYNAKRRGHEDEARKNYRR